jgi:alpha-tubulin suppressor-like RCC1 family protein
MRIKRIISICIAMFFSISLCSCGGGSGSSETKTTTSETVVDRTDSSFTSTAESMADSSSEPEVTEKGNKELKADFKYLGDRGFPAILKDNGDLYVWKYEIKKGKVEAGRYEGSEYTTLETTSPYDIVRGQKKSEPYRILSNVKEFSMEYNIFTAVTNNGELYSWGVNTGGDIGCGDSDNHTEPVKIMDDVKTAGYCYAIKNNGDLYIWGSINPFSDKKTTPQKILSNVVSLKRNYESLNNEFSCFALTATGDLYTWGNIESNFGVENPKKNAPNLVLSGVKDYQPSNGHDGSICTALKENGDLYIWGKFITSKNNGQTLLINHGKLSDIQKTPFKVMSNIRSISGNVFVSNDNTAYKFYMNEKHEYDTEIISYAKDVAEAESNYYYKTDGSLVAGGVVYKDCKVCEQIHGECLLLINSENNLILANLSSSRQNIPEFPDKTILTDVIDASDDYVITGDNKLYFWDTDSNNKLLGPVEIKIP